MSERGALDGAERERGAPGSLAGGAERERTLSGDPTAGLDPLLSSEQAGWLAGCCAAAADPAAVLRAFPAFGRRLGRGPLRPGADPGDLHEWTVDDAGRVRLLQAATAATAAGGAVLELLQRLYEHGDAAERRGVVRALDVLPIGAGGLPLLRDALRTNDVRLVAAAAAGRYAARELPPTELDQAVLKCLFVGVPLAGLTALPARTTARTARMVADFAHERVAAGRDVPADAWLVLAGYPEVVDAAGLPTELVSALPERRAAAGRFFAARPAAVAEEA